MYKRSLILAFIAGIFPLMLFAQKSDSAAPVPRPILKNVIKFNPTPMILWSPKNVTFSYERILSPRQSLSIELGYLEFQKLIDDTVIDLVNITSHQKWGLNATLEYRFYLVKLNARPIPAGLYIGPYLTFYTYHFNNGLEILPALTDTVGSVKGDFWSFNLGFELGYQFVFWKRWTLDLVMVGPSMSYYGGKTEIRGELDANQIHEMNEAFYDKLVERYPGITNMSLDKTFQQTGKLDVFRLGFRYLVQIGFRF
jgi:hypothetical protein